MNTPQTTQLPQALQDAYRAALYQVHADDGAIHTLKVGQRSDWLAHQLKAKAAQGACFLTACNPWGELLSAADNAARMNALRQSLNNRGLHYNNGSGEDPNSQWPGEDSVLIWNMDTTAALQWGQQWKQNAVLWSGADGIPHLLWLR